MSILEKITAVKREEVSHRKTTAPVSVLERSAFFNLPMPSFLDALSKPVPSIIGEFKRKSPSKGDINPHASIREVALGYQDAGIAAMSVLTDEVFFGGKNSDLQDVANLIKIPLLRKDFIIDAYQVYEAKAIGASAILLIASILTGQEVELFSAIAHDLGMDVLFEIHDLTELEKMGKNMKIIGVNNRDLDNFKIHMDTSLDLLQHLPHDCMKVAESGFQTPGDVMRLYKQGYNAFLIGEYFMKSDEPWRSASLFISNLNSRIE